MKMNSIKYKMVIVGFIFCSTISINAQDTLLNRNVSVEREYRPVIQDAGKINSVPKTLEPIVDKTPVKYSDFNLPLNAEYNIHLLPAAELLTEKPKNNEGYARVGFGTYLNTLLDFAYPVINKPDMRLDFSLNHNGTLEQKRFHTNSSADISFNKIFKTIQLYATVGGGHEYFKYYGNNSNLDYDSLIDLNQTLLKYPDAIYKEVNRAGVNNTAQNFPLSTLVGSPTGDVIWKLNSGIGVSSIPLATDLHYKAEVNYNLFSSVNGLTENIIHTIARFSSPNNKNRMGIDLEMYNMMYASNTIVPLNFWDNYSILTLNPYYNIEKENWNVRLGLKSAFSFVHGNLVNPAADVQAEWKPFPKVLSIYGGISGDYEVNTLTKMYAENSYLNSGIRVNDTYSPYSLFAGIKLKPMNNLFVDAFINFKQIDNQYFFVNKSYKLQSSTAPVLLADSIIFSNRFNVVYSNTTLLKIGARISYHLKDFLNVELKGSYNDWNTSSEMYAWNKPVYEAALNANVKVNSSLGLSVNAYYEGGRYAKLGNIAMPMNDVFDINLGATYTFNNWLNAFAKVNNLLNSSYQNYYGYDVQGINFMVGAGFTF